MKRLVLSALLLSSSFAVAGGAGQPVTGGNVLRLTAPVGTAVSYQMTTRTRVQVGDVTVTARPGASVDQATLDLTRDALRQGFSQNMQNLSQTTTAQATYRVTGRDAAGNVTLNTTVTQSVPKMGTITITVAERITPSGQRKVMSLKTDSTDPQIRALFAKLTPEQLNAFSGQQTGGGSANLYGTALVRGKSRTVTNSADVQGFLGGLLSSIPGAGSVDLKSSPLKITETTTYTGLNAQGLHTFATSARLVDPWKMKLALPGGAGSMDMELSNINLKSTQLYRRDGLPASQVTTTDMQMRMTLPMEDQLVTITMNMQQEMTLKQK